MPERSSVTPPVPSRLQPRADGVDGTPAPLSVVTVDKPPYAKTAKLPLVGATLGGVVVTAAIFLLDTHPWKAITFAAIFIVYQQVESHTLYPVVMGRTVKIGAIGVFFVTLAGAALGGILGALLAIPAGAAISIVLKDLFDERRERALGDSAVSSDELDDLPPVVG